MRQPLSQTGLLDRTWASEWAGTDRPSLPRGELRPLRRLTAALAVGALLVTLLAVRLLPDGENSPHALMARPVNLTIAWLDLRLGLGHEASGAVRAVTADPGLTTGVGRLGARWLAEHGTPAERLVWAGRLAKRDPADRPLLQAAVTAALCSTDAKVRKDAEAVADREHLVKRRSRC